MCQHNFQSHNKLPRCLTVTRDRAEQLAVWFNPSRWREEAAGQHVISCENLWESGTAARSHIFRHEGLYCTGALFVPCRHVLLILGCLNRFENLAKLSKRTPKCAHEPPEWSSIIYTCWLLVWSLEKLTQTKWKFIHPCRWNITHFRSFTAKQRDSTHTARPASSRSPNFILKRRKNKRKYTNIKWILKNERK